MKQCNVCQEKKPAHDFHKRFASKDSLANLCKSCSALQYQNKYKEKYKEKNRERYLKNKEEKNEKAKQWKLKNKDKISIHKRKQHQKPENKIKRRLEKRIKGAVANKNADHSFDIGCTKKQLAIHIESKMLIGMTWDNYGKQDGWCIDHIKPLKTFDLTQKEQRNAANHFSNLQPLWNFQNLKKSNNYDSNHPMGWRGLDALLSEEDKRLLSKRFNYSFQ